MSISTVFSRMFGHFGNGYAADKGVSDQYVEELSTTHQYSSSSRKKSPLKSMSDETRGIAHHTANVLEGRIKNGGEFDVRDPRNQAGLQAIVEATERIRRKELQRELEEKKKRTDLHEVLQGIQNEIIEKNGW